MKRVSQLTALALICGLASLSSMAADMPHSLTLAQLQTQNGAVIDTRISAFYNGWPQTLSGTSGHEPAALNLSASWLGAMSDEQLSGWAKQHRLTPDMPVALYGNDDDNQTVKTRLEKAGFTHVSTLSDALQQSDRLQRLAHFEQLVYPQWIRQLQQGKPVTAAPAGEWKVIEAGWGAPKLYLLSHIPGVGYLDTNEVESEPLWNKVSDEKLKAMLAKHGIRHDTTVILYGRDVYAAARVAQIMLYAGVKDVRILDGGWKAWSDASLPVERGTPAKVKPAPDFGAPIPGQPRLMVDMEQARGMLHRLDASLVSIRSWPEFIGETSGYSYIKPKGEIAGARAGAMRAATRPTWKISTIRMAPCAAPMILPPCGKRGISCRSSTLRFTVVPAGARLKPLCTPARWAGRTLPSTTAAGTNGAAIRRTRSPPGSADRKAHASGEVISA